MWIMDTDNRYGFGQQEDGTSTPSYINTFQRGAEESVWDTVDQPDWDNLSKGQSGAGYLSLFNNGGGSFASQYKYTDAPDADARMVQAAYWALQYATTQGNQSQLASTLASAAKLGDYVRYSMYDKYFKQISASCSQNGSVARLAATSTQRINLPAVLVLRLRRVPPPAPGPGGSAAPRSTRDTRTRWRRTR